VNVDRNYKRIIAGRKRRNAVRKFLLFLRIFFIIIFFAGLVWLFNFLYNSSYFKVKSITVTGNEKYSDTEINDMADVAIGLNIFEIDKKNIEDRLLDKLVWLKSINLRKVFPDSVEIIVTERKPYINVVYGGKYYIIDEEGVVLDKVGSTELQNYGNLILVKNALKYEPSIGEKVARKNMLSCGYIYNLLDPSVKKLIRESYISDDFSEDIIFIMTSEKQIIFGTSDRISDKNVLLVQILAELAEKQISYTTIDLRNVEYPIIK